jgi:hypothetical protein
MKRIIMMFVVSVLAPQITQAQGTIYLSNLGQPSASSMAVGSNSWLAARFQTGRNPDGYVLNSVQLGMADASGNPNGLTLMVYANVGFPGLPAGFDPGSSLGTLNGSTNPATGGIFTYSPVSDLTLLPGFTYFIVLTDDTAIADGAFEWSLAGANSYNPSGGWFSLGNVWTSSDGSFWLPIAGNPQFAITATAIPEPGVLSLFGLGGLFIAWHRRKAKAASRDNRCNMGRAARPDIQCRGELRRRL